MGEPSVEHTIEILKGLRDRYEAHHRVSITDGARVAAATLADRYINDRFLPDKAIDLIDEAGARMRIRRMTAPPDLREFDERIADARQEKESAIDAQDFEKAASLRDKEKNLVAERLSAEKQWRSGDMDVVAEVDDEQIAEVLGARTGIPGVQAHRGGDHPAAAYGGRAAPADHRPGGRRQGVSQAIRRTRAGPEGSPSGRRARSSSPARPVSERPSCPRRWPSSCSATTTRSSRSTWASSTTGSPHRACSVPPPAYVGYEEGWPAHREGAPQAVLGGPVRRDREGAPEIFNTLLQVSRTAASPTVRVARSTSRTLCSFSHRTWVPATSRRPSAWASPSPTTRSNYERMKLKVNDELKKHFRPEFLNRIDDVIVFHQLTQDEIIQMVDLMIGRVETQMKNKDMALELTDKAKSLLAKRGFDPVLAPGRCAGPSSARSRTSCREDPLRRTDRRSDRAGRRRETGTARATARTRSSPSPDRQAARPAGRARRTDQGRRRSELTARQGIIDRKRP